MYSKLNLCDAGCIDEEDIIIMLKKNLKELATKYVDKSKVIEYAEKNQKNDLSKNIKSEKTLLENKLTEINKTIFCLYKEKSIGKIGEIEYEKLRDYAIEEKERYEHRIDYINTKIEKNNLEKLDNKDIVNILDDFLKFEKLNRNILSALIEKITVYKNKEDKIEFKIYCKFNDGV